MVRILLAPIGSRRLIINVFNALRLSLLSLAGLFLVSSCAKTPTCAAIDRPCTWSQPIEVAGVPNLYQVSHELYRSGQPTAEGMRELEKKGIRTVINFRNFHKDDKKVAGTSLTSKQIPINTWDIHPDDDDKFLKVLEECPKPVLIHCLHGSDRTGAMVAVYRVRKQGWSTEDAIAEMQTGGTGFHKIWSHLPGWVDREAARISE